MITNCKKRTTWGFAYRRAGKNKYFSTCDEHKEEIQTRLRNNKTKTDGPICEICGGTGTIQQYRHVMNGICFRCNGKGHW